MEATGEETAAAAAVVLHGITQTEAQEEMAEEALVDQEVLALATVEPVVQEQILPAKTGIYPVVAVVVAVTKQTAATEQMVKSAFHGPIYPIFISLLHQRPSLNQIPPSALK